MNVKELIEQLKRQDQNAEVRMCMDWTELADPPEHLRQQWEDDLGGVAHNSTSVILLNKHFK